MALIWLFCERSSGGYCLLYGNRQKNHFYRWLKKHNKLPENNKHPEGNMRYSKEEKEMWLEDWNVPQFANIVKQLSLNNNH